jgi:uncharacterized membrane protein YgcG
MGFTIGGIGGLFDFNEHLMILTCMVVFSLGAIRYHDLISTIGAVGSLAFIVFYELFELEGVVQQLIPIVLMFVFAAVYFFIQKIKHREDLNCWMDCILVAEFVSLAIIYLAGNYFIVRECREKLLNQYVFQGENDIPFAYLFYFFTVAIPIAYLYAGIKAKDFVLLRVSLVALAFSAFTFKYYFSTGHHEITFTVAGALLLIISITLLRYLKTTRNGFTSENIIDDKWSNSNAEAFIISQTLGGNKGVPTEAPKHSGGGSFGGGGASGEF